MAPHAARRQPLTTGGVAGDALAHSFRDVADRFRQAVDGRGLVARRYLIAGRQVQVRFAGRALIDALAPALAHLAVADTHAPVPASLTIDAWDSASTAIQAPAAPWYEIGASRFSVRHAHGAGDWRAAYQPAERAISILDVARGAAAYWVPDARGVPFYDTGSPFRLILQWWAARHGVQCVHAGAVATAAGGVLLVGPTGSGKSTTALACLLAGFQFAGDDFVLVEGAASPWVWSLYSSAKLDGAHLTRFPSLAGAAWNADRLDREKGVVLLRDHHPEAITQGFRLRAAAVVAVGHGSESSYAQISAGAALRAAAPSTILQLPGAGADAFAALADLLRRLPCYRLTLGQDLAGIPPAVARMIDAASS